ncbi:selenocysteine insertion sequence-binding protein 2 isoform X3 [Neophocaena asiaeorientalis asiaeorientalis]|uniref:Selenocysteine insertion sequence-binding protein 2 isoform X3 n=1 Tax=Neophocaena asiaeorientalis asiaeorientalis TaxID=1706337 RepID=A0A341AEZ9_NEOAA|nr:selenocysteine insertion sequence-binding protein 2 isoform X3 [Neophocaena asiaeorientalis asiaeorientalis]XP_032490243.1 selenocysteine insertion sequence-binding protein 2 isoform X3 [Phocoena sinus]
MASEGPREPAGEGIKLSADVKPFVPKFAGLSVTWSESSEARVFPSCAATTYYPCVQELAVPEQKLYAEDMAFGASTFPPQYLSPEIPLHPYAYSPYTLESSQNVCPVPGSQYDYNQPGCFGGFQTVKPRNEHVCPLPQDTKALFKKKTCDEQKFDTKKTDGPISSDLKSVKSSPRMSIHAENSLKSDGYYKRTDRKSRIIEKSGSASKPEFEFTRLDFPELQGRENSEIPEIQKQLKWGPLRSASTDVSLLREVGKPAAVLAEGEIVVKNNNRTESVTDNAATSPSSCTRADPRNGSMSSSEVLSSEPSYKEKHVVHPTKKSRASQGDDTEQNEASRKNKKKKEKSKSKYEVLTVQEPPRIEDAEEFPNLAVASERRDRVESPKFQSKQQPQNNFKSSGKKSQIPVQLDLGGMLTALEKKQHSQNAKQSSKPVVFSVGAVPVLSKDSMSGKKGHRFGQVKTPHNPLDSSAPLMKKGKQREVPKAKKPTSLKKIILKERQERKQQRLQESAVSPAFASDDVQDGESGGDDQALGQADPSGGTEELVSCASVAESKSEDQLGAEPQKEVEACPKIHSRRFRDYCSQMLSKEVDACVTDLLKELVRFQDRMYQKDPVKAKTKRRLVLGLREVLKHLKLKKLKCVIISPNCEKIQSKGGLDDTLHTIIDYACEQNIPFVFALNRKALGRSLNKAVPVSVVGIFSYDGAQDQFHKMVELTMAARQAYRTMLENAHWELPGEPGPLAPASPPTQGPSCSAENRPLAPAGKEEPHYIEIWRNHLEAYTQRALELEESLEASTSQMMNLNL